MEKRKRVRVGDVVRIKMDQWWDAHRGQPLVVSAIKRYDYHLIHMETRELVRKYPHYRYEFEHDTFLTAVARRGASAKRKEERERNGDANKDG